MKKHVKQLVLILCAAVIGSFFLTLLIFAYKGSSEQEKAYQLLISPDVIEKISFNDTHPTTAKVVNFVFNRTEFVYFDYLKGEWLQEEISIEKYAKFYQLIALDEQIENDQQQIKKILPLFQNSSPLALITSMRTDEIPQAKIYQVVQLTKENYFRIKLHGHEEGKWAYFYHPFIYKNIMTLFTTEK